MGDESRFRWVFPFASGLLAGAAGAVISQALAPRRGFDPRLIRSRRGEGDVLPTVVVPGLLGSELLRPEGTKVWLNVGNALGYHDIGLPLELPLGQSRDHLVPGGLLGVDSVLPRLFGFTEYAELLELLESGGFVRDRPRSETDRPEFHVFTYDWRRDAVESARQLHDTLENLAEARGERDARFNIVGHSMGGLVARYYLRYGRAEPGGPVTWAGAARLGTLALVATPNAGSIHALDAMINGHRVGLSATTLAPAVVARMPAIHQLLPPKGTDPLLNDRGERLEADLHDPETWRRFGWGPYSNRRTESFGYDGDIEAVRTHFVAALTRAAAFHQALAARPPTPCPARVVLLGGDCLPTLARAVIPGGQTPLPRLQPASASEAKELFEAGDGRVTRASVLASHLPAAEHSELDCGLPEVSGTLLGSADHHGIYSEPTFQSLLLRLLLRPQGRGNGSDSPER